MRVLKILGWVVVVVIALLAVNAVAAAVIYSPQYVYRVLAWQESDAFDWQKFPSHPLRASSSPSQFAVDSDPRVTALFEERSGAEDWESFLADNETQAFIVIQDGTVRYEHYFNDTRRESIVTSFSVAKSFTSALIGIALDEGFIGAVTDPVTGYLPELAERDARFSDITIRDLLRMASGLEYREMRPLVFNGDDPLTAYFTDQRRISLQNTRVLDAPGEYFLYNKYHPQLLGMILERTTGMTVTEYLQTRIWDPVGMQYDGSWSTDSTASDFEKMETGVNARALDFARFGLLFLNGGRSRGDQVISSAWVDESTQPFLPEDYDRYYNDDVKAMPGRGYYNYMWWGMVREDGSYDFTAEGDRGQFIYVSPSRNLIIVRNGVDWGIPSQDWLKLFFEFSEQY